MSESNEEFGDHSRADKDLICASLDIVLARLNGEGWLAGYEPRKVE